MRPSSHPQAYSIRGAYSGYTGGKAPACEAIGGGKRAEGLLFCLILPAGAGITQRAGDGSLGRRETLLSEQARQRRAKMRFASSSVSFDPMSYQSPGTVHV